MMRLIKELVACHLITLVVLSTTTADITDNLFAIKLMAHFYLSP